ncbi:bifunctional phosphopantothenoylcysteine decarboxylase/phosphopantothenate synthase [compost metagenome]
MLKAISKSQVYYKNKQLDNDSKLPLHKIFAAADLVVVYPATPRILVEAHNGAITCPVTRTIAFAPAERVLICPAIHPDLNLSVYKSAIQNLIDRNFTVIGADTGIASWAEVEIAIETMLCLTRSENPHWRFNASSS